VAMRVVSMSRRVASWSCRASSKRLTPHKHNTKDTCVNESDGLRGPASKWGLPSQADALLTRLIPKSRFQVWCRSTYRAASSLSRSGLTTLCSRTRQLTCIMLGTLSFTTSSCWKTIQRRRGRIEFQGNLSYFDRRDWRWSEIQSAAMASL
jgi:hypothetical protein